MTYKKRKIMNIMIAASMVLTVGAADIAKSAAGDAPLLSSTASAAGEVSYIDENGIIQYAGSCVTIDPSVTDLNGGWYVVRSSVTVDQRIYTYGTVNIILTSGSKLVAKDGINVDTGSTLNIYTQESGSGSLYAGTTNGTVTTAGGNCSGIGGDHAVINIHGGRIYAKGGAGAYGIEGSVINLGWTNAGDLVYSSSYSNQVNMTKLFADCSTGSVFEYGAVSAANAKNVMLSGAIAVDKDTFVLDNGTYVVMANTTVPERMEVNGDASLILTRGVYLRAEKGITVEYDDTLTIYGTTGKLYAGTRNGSGSTADDYHAGIGTANGSRAGNIIINGGNVYASGGSYAAGIGGSKGHIEINNGTVNAEGGMYAAGIGSGYSDNGCDIRINGGNVTAYGGESAAGIGNGFNSTGSAISLNWTKAGDQVYSESYNGSVSFLRDFVVKENGSIAVQDNIDGKTLIPSNGAYTVSFETNGGTAVSPVSVAQGQYLSMPQAPVKNGFTFSGWYLDAACTQPFNFSTVPINKDYVLYAKWTSGSHTVTFNTNGGSYIAPISVNDGAYVPLNANPSKQGCTFDGWYTDRNCTLRFDPNTQIYNDTVLYAKWTNSQLTVTFETNGGSYISPMTVSSGQYLSDLPISSRNGYTFGGWYLDRNCTQSAGSAPITKNTVLYAKWQQDTAYCTVTFSSEGGSYVAAQTVQSGSYISEPYCYRNGYIFTGWWLSPAQAGSPYNFAQPVTKNITLYAGWEKDTPDYYTVTYDTMGGAYCSPAYVQAGGYINSLPSPSKAGYIFNGWYTDAGCTIPYDFAPVYGDMVLFAGWTKEASYVTVSFESCGGSYVASQTVQTGSYISEPYCYRDGFRFTGWWLSEAQAGSPYSFDQPITGSLTLYAGWEPIGGYDDMSKGGYYYGSTFGGIGVNAAVAAVSALVGALVTALVMNKRK